MNPNTYNSVPNQPNESDDGLIMILSHIAYHNPESLSLAAQLFGVPPCPDCGYIKEHCRCNPPKNLNWEI